MNRNWWLVFVVWWILFVKLFSVSRIVFVCLIRGCRMYCLVRWIVCVLMWMCVKCMLCYWMCFLNSMSSIRICLIVIVWFFWKCWWNCINVLICRLIWGSVCCRLLVKNCWIIVIIWKWKLRLIVVLMVGCV